jgi:glycosyltransferase involved in cell wall biosynthesis
MRVALFTDADVYAGTESHIFELGRGLRSEGVEVRIACPTPAPLAEKAASVGLAVLPIQKQGLIDREAVRTLVPLLQSGAIDIVHAHNGRTMLSSALAVTLARRGRCLCTQHFLEPDHVSRRGLKSALYHTAHRWVNGRMSALIAISEAVRQEMLKRREAPESKIAVVPNGIPEPELPTLTPAPALRAELGIGTETPLIVCVARLQREKDIRSLVAAMTEVTAACPSVRCLIAGEGAEKEALAAQIREADLEASVSLLGFRKDALSLIQAGDVFVLPSLAEPFGLVLLEAMALGKPVIATRAGGPPEIVRDGETGLLVPPSDPKAMAEAILRLLADPQVRQAMARRGRERYQTHYTVERMTRATLALYQRALRTGKK